jgi:mycoredoxin
VTTDTDVTIYSTVWCGYCSRLKAQMTREGITFTEVDIELDPEAAAFVESVNGGNQTVPTVLFADGTATSNPPIGRVKELLGR